MNDLRIFAAQLRADVPIIDLHGLRVVGALDKLDIEVDKLVARGDSEAKVVYGIGTGALREAVVAWLQKSKAVATIHEDVGACIIIFK